MDLPARNVYCFGDFVLDPADRSLLRRGSSIPLTPKVFDALLLLVENAGHVVGKDEFIQRLWPGTFVGDYTLAQNISLLRKALADGSDGSSLIVTVPRVGYRFTGPVSKENVLPETAIHVKAVEPPRTAAEHAPIAEIEEKSARFRVHPALLIAATLTTGIVASVLTYFYLAPRAAPKVTRTLQLTFSGRVDPWGSLVSDGTRLYFLERAGDHWNLAQISLAGGETQVVAAPFRNTLLLGLSPDRGEFLLASFVQRDAEMPLWTWPVQGGPVVRVGDLTAYDAAWHPNGRQIVYSKDQGVFIADRDGSHSRLFATTRGQPLHFSWSHEGRVLRFSVSRSGVQNRSLWETNADGSNLHQLLPQWSDPPWECCGSWSQDDRYFVFGAQHGGTAGLWAIREPKHLVGQRELQPFLLTTQAAFEAPLLAGSGGQSLYAISLTYDSEVVSYSEKSRQFAPILKDKHAAVAAYSDDGEWVAYITPPDGALWRAKRDGSLRIPLAPRSLSAASAVWSPDARQVAFVHRSPACENKIFLVSAEGGTPRDLFPNECAQLDPAWSPDGKRLTFVRAEVLSSGATAPARIEELNLADNKLMTIPGSERMRGPSWSSDGRFLAAVTEDLHHLMLYDVQTQKWTKVHDGTLLSGLLSWSRDGAFLYFQDLLAPNQPVYRVRRGEHRPDQVVNFESLIREGVSRCGFIGLAPDGSVLATLLKNQGDIFQLDVSLP